MASASSVGATRSPAARQALAAAKWRRDHLFFTVLPVVMFAAVVVGFSQTYYLKSLFGTPALTWLYHVHGIAFTCWLLLLIVQPSLVLAGRTPLHRQFGWAAIVLVPVMTVLAWFVSVDMARRGAAPPGISPLMFMVVPMATVVIFPAFVGAALFWRRNPDVHKRLMLIATLELVPAGVARIPGILPLGPLAYFGLTDLFLVAIGMFDVVTRRRLHPATLWGGALLITTQIGRFVIGSSAAWESFAKWAIS